MAQSKERHTEYMKTWRAKNRSKHKQYLKNYKRKQKKWLNSLKNKPCTDCGQSYPHYVMDWDHISGEKKFCISQRYISYKSRQAILDEIAKCELVCANCHRIRTHARGVKPANLCIRKKKFEVSKEDLERLVWEMPTTAVAKIFGVSDKAIEKRCLELLVPKPPRGYWQKRNGRMV